MARVSKLNVMLEEDVKEKFHAVAVSMGLTDSALGAFLVGNYVRGLDIAKPMQEALNSKIVEVVDAQFKSLFDLMKDGSMFEETQENEDRFINFMKGRVGDPGKA